MLLTNSLRTGLLAWFSSAAARGIRAIRPRPASDGQTLSAAGRPRVPAHLGGGLLSAAGLGLRVRPEPRRLELATTARDEEAAERVWGRPAIARTSRVVVFNSGGAYGGTKHWPPAHFADLARRLAQRSDTAVLVLCGPAERDAAREVVRLAACPGVTSLADEPSSLGLSKACIRRANWW